MNSAKIVLVARHGSIVLDLVNLEGQLLYQQLGGFRVLMAGKRQTPGLFYSGKISGQ